MRNATTLIVGLTALFGVAACDSTAGGVTLSSPPAVSAQPSNTGLPSAYSFSTLESLDTKDAIPATAGQEFVEVLDQSGDAGSGASLAHIGLTPEGQLISAANPPPDIANGTIGLSQSEVRLYDERGIARLLSLAPQGPPRQAFQADSNEHAIAWIETTSTDLYHLDWHVYAFDRADGRTRLLGESAAVGGDRELPHPPGAGLISVGSRKVFWCATYPTDGPRDFGAKIVAAGISGKPELRTVVEGAKLPATTEEALYYVRSEDVMPGFPIDRYEIHRIAPDGSDRVAASGPLGSGEQVVALVAESDHVSWIVSGAAGTARSTLFVWRPAQNSARQITLHDTGNWMFLSASPRRVVVSNGSGNGDAGQYVVAVASGKIWRVGEAPGLSVIYAAGEYVAWSRLGEEPQFPDQNSMTVARWIAD